MADPSLAASAAFSSLVADLSVFRTNRIREAVAGQLVAPLASKRAVYIHVLPVGGLNDALAIGPHSDRLQSLLPLLGASTYEARFNADGYLVNAGDWGHGITAYVQWLRCGGFEAFTGNVVRERGDNVPFTVPTLLSSILAEYLSVSAPTAVIGLRDLLNIERPLAVSAMLIGMNDVRFAESNDRWPGEQAIGRDLVTTPWVVIAPGADPSPAILAVGDVLWQSSGFPGMPGRTNQ